MAGPGLFKLLVTTRSRHVQCSGDNLKLSGFNASLPALPWTQAFHTVTVNPWNSDSDDAFKLNLKHWCAVLQRTVHAPASQSQLCHLEGWDMLFNIETS